MNERDKIEIDKSVSINNKINEEQDRSFGVALKKTSVLKSIHLSEGRFVIFEEAAEVSYQQQQMSETPELPGVYLSGTQYYDLKNIYFMDNTGIANLIDLLKSLLEKNVEVQFVNVTEKIKNKVRSLGLDKILICV